MYTLREWNIFAAWIYFMYCNWFWLLFWIRGGYSNTVPCWLFLLEYIGRTCAMSGWNIFAGWSIDLFAMCGWTDFYCGCGIMYTVRCW